MDWKMTVSLQVLIERADLACTHVAFFLKGCIHLRLVSIVKWPWYTAKGGVNLREVSLLEKGSIFLE